jgi:sec-independent protein translocase protein TatA
MFGMKGSELLIVFGLILLLFGATRLPALGKALGEGMKNFKKGISDGADEGAATETDTKPRA